MEPSEPIIVNMKEAAWAASEQSYSPYSNFKVGAAVLTISGEVFTGCNVENASYGLSICAERNSVFQAISNRLLKNGVWLRNSGKSGYQGVAVGVLRAGNGAFGGDF